MARKPTDLPPDADPSMVHDPKWEAGQVFRQKDGTGHLLIEVIPRSTWNQQVKWKCLETRPDSPDPREAIVREPQLGEVLSREKECWEEVISWNRKAFERLKEDEAIKTLRSRPVTVDIGNGCFVSLTLDKARDVAEQYLRIQRRIEKKRAKTALDALRLPDAS